MVSAAAEYRQQSRVARVTHTENRQQIYIYIYKRESMKKTRADIIQEREKLKQTPPPDHNTYTPFSLP